MFMLGTLIWVAELVIGFGLVINCSRGLLSREGMYDSGSTDMMIWSQLLGIAVGLGLLAVAFGLVHLPLLWGLPFVGGGGGGG